MNGISKSRSDFENTPDNALFGKNISRIFNYIECYIFRFLFVGILIVMILHPLINIINIAILIFLSITAWLWVLLFLIISEIFRFLVYDFLTFYQRLNIDLKFKKNKMDFLLHRS